MADHSDARAGASPASTKQTRRHFVEALPMPAERDKHLPVWKRAWFWMFAAVLLLLALPVAGFLWNIFRPDASAPAKVRRPDYAETALADAAEEVARARVSAALIATLPADAVREAAVLDGRRFDAVLTPRFLDAYAAAVEKASKTSGEEVARSMFAPFRLNDIRIHDGMLRARAAHARAEQDAAALAETYEERLALAGALTVCTATPADFKTALEHERDVLAEIRLDDTLLARSGEGLKKLLAALLARSRAPSAEQASVTALAFDAALDETPDAGLRFMRGEEKAPLSGNTLFDKLARLSRRPNAHRANVSAMMRRFGAALAKPTFAEARATLSPSGEYKSVRLATILLRETAIEKTGSDIVANYFFPPGERPSEGLETFLLKATALSDADDVYGEAFLLQRRAMLTGLIADRDRTRFEAGATLYALAVEYRRAAKAGARPKDSEGLLEGLSEFYPLDPFTDEPPAYSRRRANIHSPGADGVDRGGLDDPQFEPELALLWEPTVSLDHEEPIDLAAFGLKPSDLDKPIVRGSDLPPPRP